MALGDYWARIWKPDLQSEGDGQAAPQPLSPSKTASGFFHDQVLLTESVWVFFFKNKSNTQFLFPVWLPYPKTKCQLKATTLTLNRRESCTGMVAYFFPEGKKYLLPS